MNCPRWLRILGLSLRDLANALDNQRYWPPAVVLADLRGDCAARRQHGYWSRRIADLQASRVSEQATDHQEKP